MAVRLTFLRPQAEPLTSGPHDVVSFRADQLIAGDEVIARYVEHRWQVGGGEDRFSSVEFRARVEVHFEQADERSRSFGPYKTLSLIDGVAYAGGHVFAFLDQERQDWYSLTLGNHWVRMTVSPSSA